MRVCPQCGKEGIVKDRRGLPGRRWRRRSCPVHGNYTSIEISSEDYNRLHSQLKTTSILRREIKRFLPFLQKLLEQ